MRLLEGLGGSCHTSVAVHASGLGTLHLRAELLSPDGQERLDEALSGAGDPRALGLALAAALMARATPAIRASLEPVLERGLSRPVLLVTRPAEEAGRTAAAAAAVGFDVVAAPLLTIEPVRFQFRRARSTRCCSPAPRAPALAATGAPELLALPAYAVGARTAEALEAAGFRLARMGEANGSAILGLVAAAGVRRILHLAGEATAPAEVPPGLEVVRVPVYAARRVAAMPPLALDALRAGWVFATLLFSARTARHFRRLADEAGLDPGLQRIVALSPAVAEGAGPGWAAVGISEAPDLDGALAAARGLWQSLSDGR